MHSSASSRSAYLSIALCLFLAGCPPTAASCPTGFQLSSDGRCVMSSTDGGTGGDGSVSPDTGMPPMLDAGVGPDGCALHTYYADTDGDGFGDASATMFACEMPTGYAAMGTDCDDTCATCHPGASEVCEGALDEDCDGTVDQPSACSCTTGMTRACGASSTAPCHMGTQMCTAGTWGACTGNVEPMAELCNGVDDDCNGSIDDGVPTSTYYVDADGDGHGIASGATMTACAMPSGYAASSDDCDDTSGARFPGNSEMCDAVDNDCNAGPDDTFACVRSAATTCTTSCGSMGTGICTAACARPAGAACSPPTEICNGLDENCDGIADDGLGMLGSAVTTITAGATTATTYQGVHLVATSTGYMAFGQTKQSPSQIVMHAIQPNGSPTGATIPLDVGIAPASGAPFTVHAAGANFLLGWGYSGSGTTGTISLAAVNAAGGNVLGPDTLPLPAGTAGYTRVVIADADATSATVYATLRSVATPITYSIRRYRLNLTGTNIAVTGQVNIVTNLSGSDVFDVVTTSTGDYVAYLDTTGNLKLAFAPSSGAAPTLFTTTLTTGATGVAIAIGNPAAAVTSTNPLGLAWQDTTSEHFVEIQALSGTTLTLGTAATLTGGTGRSILFPPPRWIDIVAVPNGSTGPHAGYWFVASSDSAGSSSVERAWDVAPGSTGPSVTAFTVSGPAGAVGDLSIATGASGLRFAHATTTGAVVTRQLGCR